MLLIKKVFYLMARKNVLSTKWDSFKLAAFDHSLDGPSTYSNEFRSIGDA